MKKVALYLRVSTVDKGQTTETQKLPLLEFAERRGWEVYKIYEDHSSGAKESRPALTQLLNDAKKCKYDIILVQKFDRFARSSKQLINSLELFDSLGIQFVSYSENIDFSSAAGKMMFTLISAFAEFERSLIVERVKAGLYRAKTQGKVLGRKPRKVVNSADICQLREQGLSIREIAKRLDLPKSTVAIHCPKSSTIMASEKP